MIENVIVRRRRTFLGGSGGHAPPENFENVGSLKPNFPHFETHFRQIETVFICDFDI